MTATKPVRAKLATKKKVASVKRTAAPGIAATAKIVKINERAKTGPKTDLLGLIPRAGITFKALEAKAAASGIDADKVRRWVPFLRRYEYIEVR